MWAAARISAAHRLLGVLGTIAVFLALGPLIGLVAALLMQSPTLLFVHMFPRNPLAAAGVGATLAFGCSAWSSTWPVALFVVAGGAAELTCGLICTDLRKVGTSA